MAKAEHGLLCTVCGQLITAPRYRLFCSKECHKVHRREQARMEQRKRNREVYGYGGEEFFTNTYEKEAERKKAGGKRDKLWERIQALHEEAQAGYNRGTN